MEIKVRRKSAGKRDPPPGSREESYLGTGAWEHLLLRSLIYHIGRTR